MSTGSQCGVEMTLTMRPLREHVPRQRDLLIRC